VNKQISELTQTSKNQNIVINNVVNRLNFMLSMFSIHDMFISRSVVCPVNYYNQLPVTVDGDVSEVSYTNHTDHTDQSGHYVGNKTAEQLYSSALDQNNQHNQNIVQQQPLKQLSQFRQSMVAAVYID